MSVQVKSEHLQISRPEVHTRKDRVGRWSKAQSYLFQSLLMRYGKNWKTIHNQMKNRTLSQIRSHAQKYFDKIGPQKVQEYEHRAKLLEAYETLQKEKQISEISTSQQEPEQMKSEDIVKHEEESPLTGDEIGPSNSETIIKEQPQKQIKQSHQIKTPEAEHEIRKPEAIRENNGFYPYWERNCPEGLLMTIINMNPQIFMHYRGIEPFVDSPSFRGVFPLHV